MTFAKPDGDHFYLYNSQNKYLKALGKVTKEEADKIAEGFDKIADEWEKRSNIPMPKGEYDLIYADPPWHYDFSKSKSRAIESHYQTMSLEGICNLKVPSKKDSLLYLWATAPKLLEANCCFLKKR